MKEQLDKNLKIYIINGILYSIMLNLYSPFAVKFLQRLGGTEFHISLFNALPGLVAVFAILPGTIMVMKCYNKKWITAFFFFLSRIFLLAIAFVPKLPLSWMPLVFVALMSLRNFPDAVSQTALQSFSGDLFTPEKRSTAITLRSRFSIPATLLVTLLAGQILSKFQATEAQSIFIYQVFFIIAFIVGIIETGVFMLIEEPPVTCVENKSVIRSVLDTFKNVKFTGFVKTSLPFYFAWQMGWPLFNIYHVITLGADEWWLSAITIVNSIGMFAGFNFWNRLIKRKGNGYVIWAATLGMALNPLIMAFSPNLYFITFLNLLIGFFTAGTTTVLLNYLLEVTPDENRVIYVGVYNTLINISLAISPFAAHAVLKFSNINLALIIVAFLRLLGSLLFYKRKTTPVNTQA